MGIEVLQWDRTSDAQAPGQSSHHPPQLAQGRCVHVPAVSLHKAPPNPLGAGERGVLRVSQIKRKAVRDYTASPNTVT